MEAVVDIVVPDEAYGDSDKEEEDTNATVYPLPREHARLAGWLANAETGRARPLYRVLQLLLAWWVLDWGVMASSKYAHHAQMASGRLAKTFPRHHSNLVLIQQAVVNKEAKFWWPQVVD